MRHKILASAPRVSGALSLVFGALAALGPFSMRAEAQEDQLGAPPALQFPFEATPEAPRAVSIIFFRGELEKAADLVLCKALMQRDGKPIPSGEFEDEDCLPEYKQKVAANQGDIHWASGARPIACANCIGRPFMSAQDFVSKPNLRRAMLYGRLDFVAEIPGPNRGISYSFEAYFTCSADNGQRNGNLVVDIKFSPPVIGDPGALESFLSFFTAGALSDYIEARIKHELSSASGVSSSQGACRSVGVSLGGQPKFDQVVFDPAPVTTGSAIRGATGATAALRDTATIRLLRLTRNALPSIVAPEHGHPGDPLAGQFAIFANGVQNFLPPAGLALPPEGGSVALNFCKTIDLTGADRLQFLFTNDLGGAVWSQFGPAQKFGAGGVHKMTTGRRIVLPASQGPPDPRTGRPTQLKPQPYDLREFELQYEIQYNPSPSTVGATTGVSSSGPTTGGATAGGAASGTAISGGKKFNKGAAARVLGKKPQAVLETTPCTQL